MTTQNPYRLVDAQGLGWHQQAGTDLYSPPLRRQLGVHQLDPMTYEQLAERRAPLHPVVPMPEADQALLEALLTGAGRKAIATLLRALHQTAMALPTTETLVAGRPGSWESSLLVNGIVWEGERISPSRLDADALPQITAVLLRWTTGEERVEVAENLADVLGTVIRERGSWKNCTDQWLRGQDAEAIKRWAASRAY